jgi:hypothetical protein
MINRRQFLIDLSQSAGAWCLLSSCSSFFQNTQFAEALINDQPRYKLSPIMQSLVATLLPMDVEPFNQYPLSYYEDLLMKEFNLYTERDLLFYRKALGLFNDPRLFSFYPPQFLELEEDPSPMVLERDRGRFQAWSLGWDQDKLFSQLEAGPRQSYLSLWMQSPLDYKRAFFRASKSLAYAAVYAQEHFASTLGYEGPLLSREASGGHKIRL